MNLADPTMAEFVGNGGSYTVTLHPETQIVATRYDKIGRMAYYTVEREGKRFTTTIRIDDLHQHGANKQARRLMLANRIAERLQGLPDGEA